MRQFRETKDAVERLYLEYISLNFPNYTIFWEKFIGFSITSKPPFVLNSYPLIFPSNYPEEEKKNINLTRQIINETNYHLLCNLTFAIDDLKNYLSNSSPEQLKALHPDGSRFLFTRQRAVNDFPLHIGICRDMVSRLVKKLLKDLIGENIREPVKCKEAGYLPAFQDYLSEFNSDLAEKFKSWNTKISGLRTRLSHIGSQGILIDGEIEYIPKNLKRDGNWLEDHNTMENGNKTGIEQLLKETIIETEWLLNGVYRIFIEKYEQFLKSKNILVDYDK